LSAKANTNQFLCENYAKSFGVFATNIVVCRQAQLPFGNTLFSLPRFAFCVTRVGHLRRRLGQCKKIN